MTDLTRAILVFSHNSFYSGNFFIKSISSDGARATKQFYVDNSFWQKNDLGHFFTKLTILQINFTT